MTFFFPKNLITIGIIVTYMSIFFGFGMYHIAKFETVDEHFWKYDRIGDYYEGWQNYLTSHRTRDLRKTHINDKPGVTLALFAGTGLRTDPETHRLRSDTATDHQRYTVYDTSRTETINTAFRVPILLVNTLLLPLFFFLFFRLLRSRLAALIGLSVIALSPVLVGMSQILNPDALLWSFGSLALFAYLLLLRTNERTLLVLTTVLTGLAVLSKYTANILFLFYPMLFTLHALTTTVSRTELRRLLLRRLAEYSTIAIGTAALFTLFMPAVFVKTKYLIAGTIGSPAIATFVPMLAVFLGVVLLDALVLRARLFATFRTFLRPTLPRLIQASALIMLVLYGAILLNAWLGEPWVSFHNIKEISYVDGELLFPQFADDAPITAFLKKLIVEVTPFVFAQLPVVFLVLLAIYLMALLRPRCIARQNQPLFLFFLPLPLLYAIGALGAGVFVNYRYMILLYPLFASVTALGVDNFARCLFSPARARIVLWVVLALITLNGITALWQIKPFYFNYMSVLLPRTMVVTDAWGYGSYEAAQYLNSLPHAKDLVIWSDRSAVCQFFVGRCIRDYKIDLTKTVPDYFVYSRRGTIRHPFIWRQNNPEDYGMRPQPYYYTPEVLANPVWQLSIGGRPENFIKIITTHQ